MYYPDPTIFVRPLLAAGAAVDVRDSAGRMPLSEAMKESHADAVRLLCRHGACLIIQDDDSAMPLHHGIRKNAYEATKALLAFDFDCTIRDNSG
jgi:ankyrin repeat protein